jgi:hypothetical protein
VSDSPFVVPDVAIYSGDAKEFPPYEVWDENDVPVDYVAAGWTGWSAKWRVTSDAIDSITLTVDASEANVGVFQISATDTQTPEMRPSGVWDLQGLDGDGKPRTLFRGKTTWVLDVTRP